MAACDDAESDQDAAPPPAATTEPESTEEPPDDGTATTDDDAILAGDRQITIEVVEHPEMILLVDGEGRLGPSPGPDDFDTFVLVPSGEDTHMIRTAVPDESGEPACMGIDNSGTSSLTVLAAACDAGRDGQLFTIEDIEDGGYAISNNSAYLQLSTQSGDLIAEELGHSRLDTTFTFTDEGEAPAAPGE
ncbi:RICIN domain-containing protein [Natronosporangium hydrolyticum]|uniref:RICIN domain-containing protein n=1 Tax=Natronosporangium hydrolyticum TaxID=2811111 RepID=A0A895YL51_9ACTN|nr:RICIN domain-containing protein [Natronosporangium hydrolyticum]QSB16705.1 RICIN domain-containing protein [Natronosporangium hydrolyticum]